MRVHRQQHSFQTVYKKIKNQSNNPCACQDRTKQHIRTLQCTYLFVVTELDYWSFFFFRTKTLTYDSFTTWQQTFENKTKQKTHWKMTKAVVNLMTTTVKQNLQTYLHWSLTKIETYLISIIFKPSMPNTVIETSRIKKGRFFFFFCPGNVEWTVEEERRSVHTNEDTITKTDYLLFLTVLIWPKTEMMIAYFMKFRKTHKIPWQRFNTNSISTVWFGKKSYGFISVLLGTNHVLQIFVKLLLRSWV